MVSGLKMTREVKRAGSLRNALAFLNSDAFLAL
jgi:hypothetical protein